MAFWQTVKIIGDPSVVGLKGYSVVPTAINLVQHNSTHSVHRPKYSQDDKIKWQWAVRCKPTSDCPHSCVPKTKCIKKQGWIAWIMRKKPEEIIVDKENCPPREPEKVPKIWEWEYYTYLIPDSYLQKKQSAESCRLQIMENRRKSLHSDSLECLNRDIDLYVKNAERERENIALSCEEKREKIVKVMEQQPCPPPLPKEPRSVMLKNCQNIAFSTSKVPASMDEFDQKLPYEDKPLKITTTYPKQYKLKANTKTPWNSFPPISDEEVKLVCSLDFKSSQLKQVECPKSMYLRFKNVSQDKEMQPVSCTCTLIPVYKGSKPAKPMPIPCESGGNYWGGKNGEGDMFKCMHPLEKRK